MLIVFLLLLLLLPLPLSAHAEDLGELSANPYHQDSTSNPFVAGSPFKPDGINNSFSPYGSPFSNQSATNPFATDAPRLYDQQGQYRGKLSANPHDPDSRIEKGVRNHFASVVSGYNANRFSWLPSLPGSDVWSLPGHACGKGIVSNRVTDKICSHV